MDCIVHVVTKSQTQPSDSHLVELELQINHSFFYCKYDLCNNVYLKFQFR